MLCWLFLSIFSTPVCFRLPPSASVSVRQPTSRAKIYYPMGDEARCTHPPQCPRCETVPIHEFVCVNRLLLGRWHIFFLTNSILWLGLAESHLVRTKSPTIQAQRLRSRNVDHFRVFVMSFSCYFGYFYLFLALPSASVCFRQRPPAH